MAEAKTVRVAAVQFGAGSDVAENLKTVLRMLDEAARVKPDLVVLPEFVNHLSWYEGAHHCQQVAVPLDGPFLAAIAEKAREHALHVVVNVTLRREGGKVSGTSLLFGRDGHLLAESDKQVLMGHENDFLTPASAPCPIVETDLGRLGLYACMDGVINETPRGLAVRGAQILCNSLNSFALDEASLHVPVRAPENRVFVVAANKVGPLIPERLLEPVSQATRIPMQYLHGAGESQIVAPDGRVLAKASRTGEEVVFADIDPSQADCKLRPDGTDVFAARRPKLYAPIVKAPGERRYEPGASQVDVAVLQLAGSGEAAIDEAVSAVREAGQAGVRLVVLPELFCFEHARVGDLKAAVALSERAVEALTLASKQGNDVLVATSLVTQERSGTYHTGLLIGARGILLAQGQLHACTRHPWSKLVDSVKIEPLSWGRFALIVGDDALYPETFRLAALQDAEVVGVPFALAERWEVETGLVERSAENRLCVVAATRPACFGASLVATLWEDFTLMTAWKTRAFDGNISHPVLTRASAQPGLTRATVHPRNAANKQVSKGTDVLDGRPFALASALIS